MYTMNAILQAAALMMADPDAIEDDSLRNIIVYAKEECGTTPEAEQRVQEFADGDLRWQDGALKSVQ